ncbi:DNA cytosine methyltransferase [Microbispora rosea]|uniref:DNA cytosine methyltransferase n=1 Tax=Microbispora rosea TaxID=58117 RepID=UPI00068C8657|nr:DNA cytosine methyltransferase [Microbispora rosea]
MSPRVLDVYCCQGGASRGYELAGFDVTGVDIDPQPLYVGGPERFIQADAVAFLRQNAGWIREEFVFVHASPPCQRYSRAQKIQGREHPDLIGPTRDALNAIGLPWVIENVEEAHTELRNPVMLCGAMPAFGLRTYRHRLFEPGGGLTLTQPAHPRHVAPTAKMGRPVADGEFMHVVGNFSGVPLARQVMDMPWANRDGLREAIPPAYSRWVGEHVQAHLRGEQVPAPAGVCQPSLFDELGEAS